MIHIRSTNEFVPNYASRLAPHIDELKSQGHEFRVDDEPEPDMIFTFSDVIRPWPVNAAEPGAEVVRSA